MTQKEFFDRTGIETAAEEFEGIHRMYMATGEIDKDTFCKAYKSLKAGEAKIAIWLTFAVESKDGEIRKLEEKITAENMEKRATAEFLIGKAHAYVDTDLRKQAVKLVGEREVVLITIQLGLPLFDEDARYINNNLK